MKNALKRILSLCCTISMLAISAVDTSFGITSTAFVENKSTKRGDYCFILETDNGSINLYYDVNNDKITITDSLNGSRCSELVIPDYIEGLPVTSIARYSFYDDVYLKNVRLPDTLKTIEDHAFEDCYNVKNLYLPNGLKSVGESVFYDCDALEFVAVPSSVTYIGNNAFKMYSGEYKTKMCFTDCEAANNYAKKNGVKAYSYNTREIYYEDKCGENVSYKLYPDHTMVLSGTGSTYDYSTDRMYNMVLGIPNHSIITIDSIIINEGITRLGNSFLHGSFISEISLPDSMTSIGDNALHNAVRLKKLHIGKNFQYLESTCSQLGYTQLEEISVDPANKYFTAENNCLYNKDKTKLIKYCTGSADEFTIPDTVKTIGFDAVSSSKKLKSIVIPEGVESIEAYAFDDCPNLSEIHLPNSIKSIEHDAFGYHLDPTEHKDVKNTKTKLYAYKGSYGEEYALSSGFEYELLKSPIVHTHKYDSKLKKAATCTDEGIRVYTCSCGDSYIEKIPMVSHKYVEQTVAPTYTDQGYTLYTCYVCGQSYKDNYTDKLVKHEHSYSSKITKAATCKEDGIKTYTCNCGNSYTESIPKLTTHTFGNWTTTKLATCVEDGIQSRKCSVCGKEETKSIAKSRHKYTSKVIKPTYTAQGYTEHTCSVCGISYKDTITAKLTRTSIAKATVTGLSNKTYTGKALTQMPVVKLGTKALKSGTDYTVTYKNNKAVGTATVTFTGKGDFTGKISKTFKILPKKTTVKKVTSPKTKQMKVTYGKVAGVTGYQVTYSTSSKFTKKTTKSVNVSGTSKTIGKLTKGKTYYVKMRTYKTVNKVKYYSGWSAVKKIKVK